MMSYKVAVVGATGNVGREILNFLSEREFPATEVTPLATRPLSARRWSIMTLPAPTSA